MDYQRSLEQKEAMFELVAQVSITLRISFLERILLNTLGLTQNQRPPCHRNNNVASFLIVEVRSGKILGCSMFENGPSRLSVARWDHPKLPKLEQLSVFISLIVVSKFSSNRLPDFS